MKYKPRIYAKALADSLVGNVDDKKIVINFLKLLERNRDVKKAGEILTLAEQLLLKKTGNKKVVIETAREIDKKDFSKSFIEKGDVVEEIINPLLIAGVKVIVDGEKQLDTSFLSKLNNIF